MTDPDLRAYARRLFSPYRPSATKVEWGDARLAADPKTAATIRRMFGRPTEAEREAHAEREAEAAQRRRGDVGREYVFRLFNHHRR